MEEEPDQNYLLDLKILGYNPVTPVQKGIYPRELESVCVCVCV